MRGRGFLIHKLYSGPVVNPAAPTTDSLAPMANSNDSSKKYKPVHGSYGAGANISVRFGYKVNPYFSFDLGITYLRSVDISCDQVHQITGPGSALSFILADYYLNANIATHAYGLSMMPSFTVSGAKPGFKVYPYARFGFTLPVWGMVIHDVNIQVDPNISPLTKSAPFFLGTNNQIILETKAAFSIGVNASAGVAYKPLPFLDIFAEINGQYLDVRAKSSTITEWNADGVNEIPARGVYRTQFTYVDQLTSTSNNAAYNSNYNPNQPKQDIRPIAPFSNLGLNVGVTFYFGKNKGDKKKAIGSTAGNPVG